MASTTLVEWPAGGGDLGALIRTFDWSATSLGPAIGWPQSLKTATDILLQSPVPIVLLWGEDGIMIYNDAYSVFAGGRHPRLLGSKVREGWDEIADFNDNVMRVGLAGKTLSYEDQELTLQRRGHPEPVWMNLNYSPVIDESGQPGGVIAIVVETTAKVRAERNLRDSENALQTTAKALADLNATLEQQVAQRTADRDRMWRLSTDVMLLADFEARIAAVNPAWQPLFGWSEAELVGSSFMEFVHPDDREPTLRQVASLSEGATTFRFENRYRKKDGGYLLLSWTAVPDDRFLHAVGRDVSLEREAAEALKLSEAALHQSQKMEAVGQLTGGVAHDFNNLLTVIRSSVDLLKRPNLSDERRQRYVEAISETTTRAAKLTNQLLAFARRQALKPESFDVVQSVATLTDMIVTLTGSRIRIETDVPQAACWVHADPSQFDTSLINLAVNARDAMDGEGHLTLTIEATPAIPARRLHPERPGDFIAVSVGDTGSGIAVDDLERIFEPFFTTKEVGRGTGLGLSQVIGFAKQSGGDVVVDSTLGQGAIFTLYLPRAEPVAENAGVVESDVLVDGRGTRVLIVEDNPDVGSFASLALQELGYDTTLTTNAEQALAELAEDAGRFDVVFSDVVMPGMSGIDLGQEIRRKYNDLPVVLTSGYSHVLAQNGSYGFELLQKPYSVEQLSRVLRKAAVWRRRRRTLDARS